jgi:transcriptional regulator with XRE-family HTH domain
MDWYRQKIHSMPDDELMIGPAFAMDEGEAVPSRPTMQAFGTLVRLERRSMKLSVAQLAQAIDVEEGELRNIELDATYQPRPRTILGIAKFFNLPPKEMMKLAGAAASNDEAFVEKAMRFAAHSDDMGALSDEERKLLKSFVEFLRDHR